eukprot:6027285-Amphidinium_carterae.1
MPCFAVIRQNDCAKIPHFAVLCKSKVHETWVLSTFGPINCKGGSRAGQRFWRKNAIQKMTGFAVFHDSGSGQIPRFAVFCKSEVHETGVSNTFMMRNATKQLL